MLLLLLLHGLLHRLRHPPVWGSHTGLLLLLVVVKTTTRPLLLLIAGRCTRHTQPSLSMLLLLVVVRLLLGCRVWLRSQAAAAVRGPTAAGLQPLLQQQVQRVVAPGCRQQTCRVLRQLSLTSTR